MCDWACSKMYKTDVAGRRTYTTPWTKEEVDNLLKRYNVTLNNKIGYDYVFAANMCKADYMGSSIMDEQHVALFIKDYVDADAKEGFVFNRFYADCVGSGNPIDWGDML